MIYLVLGPDVALAKQECDRLLKLHDPDGSNTSLIDGRIATESDIIAQVATAGMFQTSRVVLVTDYLTRASKGTGVTAAEQNRSNTDTQSGGRIAAVLASVPADHVLILYDVSLGTLPASVRHVLPSNATVYVSEPPRGNGLLDWMQRTAIERGSTLERSTARYLAESLYPNTWSTKPNNPAFDEPPDLQRLINEIEKLVVSAHPHQITDVLIDELTAHRVENRRFAAIDAITTGTLREAVNGLRQLIDAGDEPAKIAVQITQQIEFATVIAVVDGHADLRSVGQQIGVANPARLTAIGKVFGRSGLPRIRTLVDCAVATDRRLKRGHLHQPEDGLYEYLDWNSPNRRGNT